MRKVINTQNVSSMCIVCGVDNALGLKMRFFEVEDGSLVGVFKGKEEHQSYPGRMHGGMICAIIDEMIGRLMKCRGLDDWGVTGEITVRFRKPVPLGVELKAAAKLERDSRRLMTGTAEILLPDGTVAASGSAKYMKFTAKEIASDADLADYWIPDRRETPEYV